MGSSPVDWEEMVQAAWEDWVRKAYQSVYLGVSIEHHRGSQPPPCQGLHHKQSLWGPSKLCQQHHLSMVPGWGKAEVWEPGRRVGICESWRLAPHAACFLQEKSYNFHSTDEETKLSWPPVIQWISDRAKIRNHAFSVWASVFFCLFPWVLDQVVMHVTRWKRPAWGGSWSPLRKEGTGESVIGTA